MRPAHQIGAICALGALLAACDTTSALVPYQPSTRNVLAAQGALRASEGQVSVGAFTATTDVSPPLCRGLGALDVSPGRSIPDFIQEALQTELFTAGVYDADAPAITGSVDELEVNTFGTGSWTIALTVRSPSHPTGYQVRTDYAFSTSSFVYAACRNATSAFNPAVQDLLSRVVNHPEFPRLAGSE